METFIPEQRPHHHNPNKLAKRTESIRTTNTIRYDRRV